ncbi:MAG: prolipoprotein diacylglyceryl transferase [Blautia sp.]|nr:prolipoprotein diacylglyceryl transferase [Blautia sp.]
MNLTIGFPNLNLQFDQVPEAFRIGNFTITMFGLLLAAGLLLGLISIMIRASRKERGINHYLGMTLLALFGALIGARAFYVAFRWEEFQGDILKVLFIRDGGLAFYGALAGGFLFAALYAAAARLPLLEMLDTMTFGVLLCQIIARWGDFFGRNSFGEYTDLPWAMKLPQDMVRASEITENIREHVSVAGNEYFIQVHPVFLYESLACLILLIILKIRNHSKLFGGEIFFLYLAGYGLIRFGTEWLRTDKLLLPGTEYGICWLISGVLFVLFALVGLICRSMAKKRLRVEEEHRERRERTLEFVEEENAKRDAEDAIRLAQDLHIEPEDEEALRAEIEKEAEEAMKQIQAETAEAVQEAVKE